MISPDVARNIRLVGFDVDGVLTDNAVFVGEVNGTRVELKRFDIQDGLGHTLLRLMNIEVFWLSGRTSAATALRGEELHITTVLQVPHYAKVERLQQLLDERQLSWQELAFVGDDLADYDVLRRVGLPIAVANAREEIKQICQWTTTAAGGQGAVREVIDALLAARGETEEARTRYLAAPRAPS